MAAPCHHDSLEELGRVMQKKGLVPLSIMVHLKPPPPISEGLYTHVYESRVVC